MSPPPAVSPLETHLGYWLRLVSNQVSQAFADKVAGYDVSVAEWVILRELFDAERAPSALAERIGMTRGAITKLADRLIAKDLVLRNAAESDGRRQVLALTKAGQRLVPKLAALADKNDEEFFSPMKPADRKAVEAAMRDIVRRLGIDTMPTE